MRPHSASFHSQLTHMRSSGYFLGELNFLVQLNGVLFFFKKGL